MLVKVKEEVHSVFLKEDDLVYIATQTEDCNTPKCLCWKKWQDEGKIEEVEEPI